MKPTDRYGTDYLSSYSILLGRSLERIGAGSLKAKQEMTDDPKAARTRYLLLKAITNQSWTVWMKTYFPTLLV